MILAIYAPISNVEPYVIMNNLLKYNTGYALEGKQCYKHIFAEALRRMLRGTVRDTLRPSREHQLWSLFKA